MHAQTILETSFKHFHTLIIMSTTIGKYAKEMCQNSYYYSTLIDHIREYLLKMSKVHKIARLMINK